MSRKTRSSKKSNKNKVIIGVIATICTVIIACIGGGYFYVTNLLNKIEKVEINENELSMNPELKEKYGDIKNIALFGVDSVDGVTGRSDSIMILTLDSTNKKIKLTSVMRDSYVNIPGRGMDKINHAYAFGGPELAIKTLNENFNLDIKDFMSVNFSTLPTIIDKLGGVTIDIKDEEIQFLNSYSSSLGSAAKVTAPGPQVLSGDLALAYSRIRYTAGGDYERTQRQRTVIDALFNTVKETSVSKYPGLISEFLPLVQTNMSANDLISLSTDFASLMSSTMEQERFPRDGYSAGQTIDGIYYLTFDIETAIDQMHKWIFEDIR